MNIEFEMEKIMATSGKKTEAKTYNAAKNSAGIAKNTAKAAKTAANAAKKAESSGTAVTKRAASKKETKQKVQKAETVTSKTAAARKASVTNSVKTAAKKPSAVKSTTTKVAAAKAGDAAKKTAANTVSKKPVSAKNSATKTASDTAVKAAGAGAVVSKSTAKAAVPKKSATKAAANTAEKSAAAKASAGKEKILKSEKALKAENTKEAKKVNPEKLEKTVKTKTKDTAKNESKLDKKIKSAAKTEEKTVPAKAEEKKTVSKAKENKKTEEKEPEVNNKVKKASKTEEKKDSVDNGSLTAADDDKAQAYNQKLEELLKIAKKKSNVLDYNEVNDHFAELTLTEEQIDTTLDYLEQSGIDVIRMVEETEEEIPDEDSLIINDEEETDIENIDLSVPEGISIEDPVRMYLKEIGKVPLLTAEQEVEFAMQMEAGAAAEWELGGRTSSYSKDLSDDIPEAEKEDGMDIELEKAYEELVRGKTKKQLNDMVRIGKMARKKLAEANLRLVVSIAKRYVGRGMLFLDLIQEGNLGLIKAVEKFDFRKGFKFSTYATWWIRQAITRSIADQARTIRIPVHMVETINKLIRISRQLLQELGREPTPEEIAEKMDVPVERVREIQKISQEPVSLETPIGEEEDSHLGDFLMDEKVPVPSDAAAFTLLKEQLIEVLDTLTEREQKVLRLRFGLDDGRARTLEEVGREFNVTRERIRQIEAKALRKLRHPSRSRKLKDYLD